MPELAHLSQAVPIWPGEAQVLQLALARHLTRLNGRSSAGQLTLLDALTLKPLARVHQQLTRMLLSAWPCHGPKRRYQPRQRSWRLGFDELLLLNRLYSAGTLATYVEDSSGIELCRIGGELNRAAQNLSYYFRL